MPEIIISLEIEPKLRCRVEGPRQAEGHVGRHGAVLVDDLGYRLSRHTKNSLKKRFAFCQK